MIKAHEINGGKETSHISMNICTSTGTWLNGCMQPQHYYVHMEIKDPNNKLVARIGLSYEQVARMMMSNGEVECTLIKYRGEDGKYVEEKVEPPKSVHQRMKERMGETQASLSKRLEDIRRDLYAMINGDMSRSKGKIEEILEAVKVVQSHYMGNETFVVKQAEEELGAMQNNAIGQMGIFLQSKFGLEAPADALKQLLPVIEEKLLSTDAKPVDDNYDMKERLQKPIDEMTAMQVADLISDKLRQIERMLPEDGKRIPHLYQTNAQESHGKVIVCYVSYQGQIPLTLDEAKKYLKYLISVKKVSEFKTHWQILEA
jgi:hypothetical protein